MNKNNFSKEGYISLLALVKKQKYIISPIKYAKRLKENGSPVLILRHDVDLDIDKALLMAQLEQENNIQATYFILLYNNFYNPFSPENKSKIIKIKKCGHEIGIHWDSRDYLSKGKMRFRRDLKLLSEIIGEKIISGSQHEPTSTPLLKVYSDLKFEAYRDLKTFVYLSDSSMVFRQHTLWELIKNKLDVQLLLHPFWWMTKGKTRREKFNNFLFSLTKNNSTKINAYYKSTQRFLRNRKKQDKIKK